MPYVLTVDQIDSRTSGDLVAGVLEQLSTTPTVLPFTRTVGDEFQGLLEDPLSVVDVILSLMRAAHWHIGLGIGSVQTLTSSDPRAARGDAFIAARTAVERAKTEPSHLVVATPGDDDPDATDVETVFRLVGAVRTRRTESGWEAVDLLNQGQTQAEAAARLSITRQALGQRAQAANWALEQAATPTLVRLLRRTEQLATGATP
ncbi:MAG TPA: transposase [Propionibacteriaceae bacterium]